MKKSLVKHILVMIIAVVVGGFLAGKLTKKHSDIVKVGDKISKAPMGGFNKFASDVQWMLFINYCGGLEAVKKENVDEIYKRLQQILTNDPNHEDAYELGGMMFSVRAPEKAVEIFTRGANNPNLKSNWKLPFYAGFVLTQHVTDEQDEDRLKKAEKMFRMALERNNTMPHVFSALIRTKAKRLLKRKKWRGIPIVNDKHAYLCALFDEFRKSGGGTAGDVFSGEGVNVVDFRPRLLTAAQKAKSTSPKNPYILETIDKVMKRVLKDDHLCSRCLTAYAAGDKFCSSCGKQVEVYGVCPVCKTVMKGKFCSCCGYSKGAKMIKKAAPAKKVKKAEKVKPAKKVATVKKAEKVKPAKKAAK